MKSKTTKVKLFILSILLIFSIIAISTITTSALVYDDLQSGTINTSLWTSAATACGSGCESSSYYQGGGVQVATYQINLNSFTAYFDTNNFANYSNVKNISVRFYSRAKRAAVGCNSENRYGRLSVFGTIIAQSGCTCNCDVSDDSIWTIIRNESAGAGKFDYYNDGSYVGQLTASNNVISATAHSDSDSGYYAGFSDITLYPINYELLSGPSTLAVTLGVPTSGSNLTSPTITFNGTINVTNQNLTNATLYIWNNNSVLNYTSTNTITGNSTNTTSWITSLLIGNYIWNIFACGDINCNFATSNNTFFLNYSSEIPTINIIHPVNNSYVGTNSVNFTWNVSDTDGIKNSTIYVYNLTGGGGIIIYKNITITETSGRTLTNYSLLLNIDYATGMQSDFDDLRFYYGSIEIPYYLESKNDGVNASVWIKIPTLTASSNTTIKMTYGNAALTSASNFNNAFIYGDDFNTDTSSRYYNSSGTICSYIISSGYMNVSTPGGADLCFITPNSSYQYLSTNYTVEVYSAGYGDSGYIGAYGYGSTIPILTADSYYGSYWGQLGNDFAIFKTAWTNLYGANFGAGQGVFRQFSLTLSDNFQNATSTFGSIDTSDSSVTSGSYGIVNYNGIISTDWFRVRTYAKSEPTYTFSTNYTTGIPESSNLINQTTTTFQSSESLYEYVDTGESTYFLSTPTRRGGQSFTMNNKITFNKLGLYLRKTGSPGIFNVSIYNVNATTGLPIGSPISNGSYDGDTLTAGFLWYNITMSDVILNSGTQYAWVVEFVSSGTVEWATNAGGYSGGFCLDQGNPDWIECAPAGQDNYFQIYGTGYPSNSIISIPIALIDGLYRWFVDAFDSLGNKAISNNQTFTLDSTTPVIEGDGFGGATLSSGVNKSQSNIYIEVNATGTNLNNITYNLYYLNETLKQSVTTTNTSHNFTNITNGHYYYNATICNLANNCNNTATRLITLDTISPTLSLTYPSTTIISPLTRFEYYFGQNALNGDSVNPGINNSYQSFTIGTTGANETFVLQMVDIGIAGADTNATIEVTVYNATNQTNCLFNERVAYALIPDQNYPSGTFNRRQNVTFSETGTLYAGKTYCIKMYNLGPTGVVWTVDRAGNYTGGYSHSNDYGNVWCVDGNCGSQHITNWFGLYGTTTTVAPVYINTNNINFNYTITDATSGALNSTIYVYNRSSSSSNVWNGLYAYYPLDNNTDVTGNGYSLTNRTGTYAAGKIGNALSSDWIYGTGSQFNNWNMKSTDNMTICLWAQTPGSQSTTIAGSMDNRPGLTWADRGGLAVAFSAAYRWTALAVGGNNGGEYYENAESTSNWRFLCTVHNQSGVHLYREGNLIGSGSYVPGYTASQVGFMIGYFETTLSYPGNVWSGLIDEVGVWNRQLSPAEIQTLYNGGNGLAYNPGIITTTTLVNQTVVTLSSLLSNNLSVPIYLPDGNYYWKTDAFDFANNFADPEENFTVDTLPPRIQIVYPLAQNYTTIVNHINISFEELNPNTCWYSLNSGITNTTYNCSLNITGLTSNQGTNTWTVYANDSANNFNYSSVTFLVDSNTPNVNLTYPANNSYVNTSIVNLTYIINDQSTTLVCATGGNVTTDGNYCINTFTTNDTFTITGDNQSLEILIVAGGAGGGSSYAGGGGAGGLVYASNYSFNGTANITVGLGGGRAPLNDGTCSKGVNGGDSAFNSFVAFGGGGGSSSGGCNTNGVSGGSGGGGAANNGFGASGTQINYTGATGYGMAGGLSSSSGSGGGGGGAGKDGESATTNVHGGYGGNGSYYPQFAIAGGSPAGWFAGGGAGSAYTGTIGIGGIGGGGNGSIEGSGTTGLTNGVNGTGGGGAGGTTTTFGSNGGNGIVMIRYLKINQVTNGSGLKNSTVYVYTNQFPSAAGLKAYYSLDNINNDSSGNNYNLDNTGTFVNGKILNGSYFNGATYAINNSFPNFNSSHPVSAFAWVNVTSFNNYRGVISGLEIGSARGWVLYVHGDGTIGTYLDAHRRSTTQTINANQWYYIGFTYDGNNLTLYLNGSAIDNYTGVIYTANPLSGLAIGNFYVNDVSFLFNGIIDEPAVWDRSLTSSEVNQLYNSGNGRPYGTSLINQTTTTYSPNTFEAIIGLPITLLDGVYRWFADVFDIAGNKNTSPTYQFDVDTIYPQVTITYPVNGQYYNLNNPFMDRINYTITELNPGTCWFELNGGTNLSLNCSSNVYYPSLTNTTCYQETTNAANAADGNCYLNYNGYYSGNIDSKIYDGNWSTGNSTGLTNSYVYMTYIPPIGATAATWRTKDIGSIRDVNMTGYYWNCFNNSIIQLRAEAHTAVSGGASWDCLNNTGNWVTLLVTVGGGSSNAKLYEEAMIWTVSSGLLVTQGNNTLTVYANDSAGNLNSSTVSFFLDYMTPTINLTYPPNNSYVNTSNVNFTYSISDVSNNCGNGGNITREGDYCIHTFYTNGTLSISNTFNAEILIIGGGGAGGSQNDEGAGGGGSGGVLHTSSYSVTSGSHNIVVGSGGIAGYDVQGGQGGNTSFDSIIAVGGGGGGKSSLYPAGQGLPGGSGGGNGPGDCVSSGNCGPSGTFIGYSNQPNYTGFTSYGTQGGYSNFGLGGGASGGGGGAGQIGENASSGSQSGNGGNGLQFNITGNNTYYAGGGGGSYIYNGVGGLGGGGNGSGNPQGHCTNASGIGSGGGGEGYHNGDYGHVGCIGSSGVVVVRYLPTTPSSGLKNSTVYVYNVSQSTTDPVWNGLYAYYRLDDNTDATGNGYNLANRTGTYSAGKIGNALDNDYIYGQGINFNNIHMKSIDNFTMCLWTYGGAGSSEAVGGSMDNQSWTDRGGIGLGYFSSQWDAFAVGGFGPTGGEAYGAGSQSAAGWQYHCVVHNQSGLFYWRDDVFRGTAAYHPSYVSNQTGIALGMYDLSNPLAYKWTGKIDEVGFWNRQLSPSEISQLYNSGNGLAYSIGGEVTTLVNQTTTTFSPGIFGTIIGIPITLADGIYKWFADVFDIAGNKATSQNQTVTVDTVPPVVTFTGSTPANGANVSQTSITVEVSVTETNEANITFRLINAFSQPLKTYVYTNATRSVTFTNLIDGPYSYNVQVCDLANECTTIQRNIFIDNKNPNMQSIAPVNGSYVNESAFYFTYAVNDTFKRMDLNVTSNVTEQNKTILLNITYQSGMQPNFDDLKFYPVPCNQVNDSITPMMTYGFNQINPSQNAIVWVIVPNMSSGNNQFCIEYGQQLSTPAASTVYSSCYQEFANVSTSCGGLATGAYATSGQWNDISLLYDGNWSSRTGLTGDGIRYYYVNYTKPSAAVRSGSILQVRRGNGDYENYTFPTNCWNQAPLQIRHYMSIPFFGITTDQLSCWDGSTYDNFWNVEDGLAIYEEAMYWNMTAYIINETQDSSYVFGTPQSYNGSGIKNSTLFIYNQTSFVGQTTTTSFVDIFNAFVSVPISLTDAVYHYFFNAFDFAGNTRQSNNITFTVDTLYPGIQFTSPTLPSGNRTPDVLRVNVTIVDINYNYTVINVYDASGVFVTNNQSTSNPFYITFTLPNGIYFYNATTYDYARNTNSTETRNVTVDIPPAVIFINQTPADISSLNLFGGVGLSINYDISSDILNTSSIRMYFKTNSTTSDVFLTINGTTYSGWNDIPYNIRTDNTTLFRLFDNNVYPAVYNLPERPVELAPHSITILNGLNDFAMVQLLGVSNTAQYNQFEIMANATSNSSGSAQVYYCNSSYSTGNPANASNCALFYTVAAGTPYDHCHSVNSCHLLIPLAIDNSTGKIGSVSVTNTSYFLFGGATGTWNIYSVSTIARPTAAQLSTDNGGTWNNQAFTWDSHLHQYYGSNSFWYYVTAATNYGNMNTSAVRQDLIDLGGLPPTSPQILTPTSGYKKGNISITYTASVSPNAYQIVSYNGTLLNPSSQSFNRTIFFNNGTTLSYNLDSTTVIGGRYIIRVQATDLLNQTSFGISGEIIIDNDYPQISFGSGTTATGYYPLNFITYNISATDVNPRVFDFVLYNESVRYRNITAYNSSPLNYVGVFSIIPNGIYNMNGSMCDYADNCNSTETRRIVLDTVSPIINYTQPYLPSGFYPYSSLWTNVTAFDLSLDNITLELNGTLPLGGSYYNVQTLTNISTSTASLFYNWTGLSQGFYNLSSYAYDQTGRRTNNTILSYNIDNEPPTINYTEPTPNNGITLVNNSFPVNVSADDPNWANMTLTIYDEGNNIVLYNFTTNKIIDINTGNLSDGTYRYTTRAYDTAGNIGISTRNITLEYYAIEVTTCRQLLTPNANYLIMNDLSTSNGTCLDVIVPGANINCQGHTIIGDSAIRVTKVGATLSNCMVIAYNSTSDALKVQGNSPASIVIYNSTFSGGLYGIYMAPESSLSADRITVFNNIYGVYFNNSNDANSISNSVFYANTEDTIDLIGTYSNTFSNISMTSAGDTSNDGIIIFRDSSDNIFSGSTFTTNLLNLFDLNDYSINNVMQSCNYDSAKETVDGTSQIIRQWAFTGKVEDKVHNVIGMATIAFNSTLPTNQVVNYSDGRQINYTTLRGQISTDPHGMAYTNIVQYMNIFGTNYPSTPYVFTAGLSPFTPTVVTLPIIEDSYHLFTLDKEIASSSISRMAMQIILVLIFLIGIAASIGFFMVRMRDGYSVVDIWKYFIILVIWLVIFTIMYIVLAGYIMGLVYPQVPSI